MLDIDIEEALITKVGGKFKLTVLIQKRMVELNRGGRPMIKSDAKTLRRLVCEEILQDKVALAPREEVGYSLEEEKARLQASLPSPKETGGGGGQQSGMGGSGEEPEIYGSDIKKIKEQRIKELAQLLNNQKQ
jgi:DNA-directed RNA polymerase subunit omega